MNAILYNCTATKESWKFERTY